MSQMPKMSNDNLALFVAVGVAVFGGFSLGRSSDDKSAEKSGQVESAEGDDTAEETRGTRSSGSQSSRSEGESRDSRLVGNWRYTETYVSDGISLVFDQFMTIEADGTMSVWDGAAAGGGSDFEYERPASEDVMTCEWRTKGNVIEIRSEGRDWTPLAEYEVNAESLLTVSSGERQLWNRI
jgi:hypothetical protein